MIYLNFNCIIPPSVEIGPNLHIAHGVGIVLHHKIKIGKNCTLYQNVTIGGSDKIIIGDNFLIGAGATVIGKVNIGNNVTIGALTFVNFDLKDEQTVVGVKGKIIS